MNQLYILNLGHFSLLGKLIHLIFRRIFILNHSFHALVKHKNVILSINFSTRAKEYNVKIKYNNLRSCDLRLMFISKFQHYYFLLTHAIYNIIILNNIE